MVSCAQIHGNPHGGGPTLLLNGVFLIDPDSHASSPWWRQLPWRSVLLSDDCPSKPCHLRCQSHTSGSRTRSDRSPDPTGVIPICATAFNQNISRWDVVQNSSLPTDFADVQSADSDPVPFPHVVGHMVTSNNDHHFEWWCGDEWNYCKRCVCNPNNSRQPANRLRSKIAIWRHDVIWNSWKWWVGALFLAYGKW